MPVNPRIKKITVESLCSDWGIFLHAVTDERFKVAMISKSEEDAHQKALKYAGFLEGFFGVEQSTNQLRKERGYEKDKAFF